MNAATLITTHVSEHDRVLIVTDNNKRSLADAVFDAAKTMGNEATLLQTTPQHIDGEEPSAAVAQSMLAHDVIFLLTTCSMTHTHATKAALANGAKVISMPNVTSEALEYACCAPPQDATITLANLLSAGKHVHITTAAGTALTLDIENRPGMAMIGICQKGGFINLPDGEALVCPTSAHGTLVIDGSMPPDTPGPWGSIGKITTPIIVTIANGSVTCVHGGCQAHILQNILTDAGPCGNVVAELGIGTNPAINCITGNITIDEKMLGTVHVALGDSSNIGGDNSAPIHLDGVILTPTVMIDDILILDKGVPVGPFAKALAKT